MRHPDLELEIERKINAITFFKEFFSDGYNLIYYPCALNDENIDEYYNFYEKHNFFNNEKVSKNDEEREFRIVDGYNYIKDKIKDSYDYELEDKKTFLLLDQYYELTNEIGKYKFVPHFKYSTGYNQNKATDDMLINLSLLEPIIRESLKDIDTFLKEKKDSKDEFVIDLNNKLKESIYKNDRSLESLQDREVDYHETWDGACRDTEYNYIELGMSKRAYRKEKNNACRRVMDCAREIVNMDQEIMQYKFNELRENYESKNKVFPLIRHANKLVGEYEKVLDRIQSGPYYYSFLTEEEIKEQTKSNKEYKKMLKKH